MSLRLHNILLIVIGTIVSVTFIVAADWEADRREQMRLETFRGDLADLARISESIIEGKFEAYDDTLLVLRDAYVASPATFHQQVELLSKGPLADQTIQVAVIDREGYLAYPSKPNATRRIFLGDRNFFRHFAAGGKDMLYIEEPIFGRIKKRYIMPLARPMYDGKGNFFGTMALSVTQESLSKFGTDKQQLGKNVITVINHSGTVVGRSQNLAELQGTKVAPELLASMLKRTEGVFTSTDSATGDERIIAFRHIIPGITPLILYVEHSTEQIFGDISRQRSVLMWSAGITALFFLILILLYLKGRKISLQLIDTLQKNKQQEYDALTQTSLDGFWISDATGRILDTNSIFCSLLGYNEEDILNLSTMDLFVSEPPEQITDKLQLVIAKKQERFQSQFRCKDGKVIDVEISVQSVGEEGETFFFFVRDISQQNKAMEIKKNLTDRLLLATSAAHLGVWDRNVRDNSMVWDERMFELYEVTQEEIPITIDVWLNRLHPEDKEAAMAAFQAAIKGEKEYDTEYRILCSDGAVKHIKSNGLVILGTDGKPARMLGTNSDITDQKRAEEENIKLGNQLAQAQKIESIGQLAGGIAHDFNNMLGVILGHAELALRKSEPSLPVVNNLKEIRNAAESSADLTRQLLTFARKQAIEPKVLDLNKTVEGMLNMIQRLIGENIHLDWCPSDSLWSVKVDSSQIDQILTNLCVNARDAISGNGKISIMTINKAIDEDYSSAQPYALNPGDYVQLSVTDDGCGMDKELQSHIFEPFFTTKKIGKGTGLGLATVYGAVKQNNGFLTLYSEPGHGTIFNIYIPRSMKKGEAVVEKTDKPKYRGTETVLLVEDDEMLLGLETTMLEEVGYQVLVAPTTDSAMALGKDHPEPIHLLISDMIMPGMNGRELAEKLKTLRPTMKVLFLSGYSADIISKQGIIEVGIHFLQKPVSFEVLTTKVREVLDSE